ncbi:MAG TPA: hypothetical protein VIB82_02025 [Caulobacteraceae bacterium]|jgi:hypothetical protein
MASAWTENGPISLPPRSLAYGVGAALCLLACVGVGLGIRAAWKENGAPDLTGAASASADSADTLIAKPIVDLPPPPVADASNQVTADTKDESKADAIQQRTAEAQQVQATASKSGGDIDQILTSPSEKPPATTKPTTDETPPGPPVKSDVPF